MNLPLSEAVCTYLRDRGTYVTVDEIAYALGVFPHRLRAIRSTVGNYLIEGSVEKEVPKQRRQRYRWRTP